MNPSPHRTTINNSLAKGRGALMRIAVTVAAIGLATFGIANAGPADASIKRFTSIPTQELGSALQILAKERDFQVLYRTEVVGEIRSPGAVGELTADEALSRLLSGTGLTFQYLDNKTVTIVPMEATPAHTAQGPATVSAAGAEQVEPQTRERGFWSRLRVAQSENNSSDTEPSSQSPQNPTNGDKLEEIVVTAQKRVERLQDVPVPVTAINAEVLANNNQLRLQDYFTQVPGLTVTAGGFHGEPQLTIRGLTTGGFTNPTVGVVVDDVPFGASTGSSFGNVAPDIDPSDLQRIEVLRGPQGMLYGANTLGGLLKFVTVDPSTDGFTGRVQAAISDMAGSGDTGYSARGSVNVPVTETFAIRASGFTRRDPGFLDNVVTGDKDINEADIWGGRVSALWSPSDTFSVKLNALMQDTDAEGVPEVSGAFAGDFDTRATPGLGSYAQRFQAYSAIVGAKLGIVNLRSVTGYNISEFSDDKDFGQFGIVIFDRFKTERFTQELRAELPLGDSIDWLVGAYYTNEHNNPKQQNLYFIDGTTGALGDQLFLDRSTAKFSERAAFSALTFKLSERFDIQFGARQSEIEQSTTQGISFPDGSVTNVPAGSLDASSFTYLVTPRFRISPQLMMYARLASGYRPGGINPLVPGTPSAFKPDKTRNYEFGVKGDLLDRLLTFDASIYFIDWQDIQLNLCKSINCYFDNGGAAKSQGVEFAIETRPLHGMRISAWASWNDAKLTEDFPTTSSAVGREDDKLPYGMPFSGSLSLEQSFPLTGQVTGFAGVTTSYLGERKDVFSGLSQRNTFPSFVQTDLRAGVNLESWTVNLFMNNVSDKRGILSGNPVNGAVTYIRPRTVGLSLTKEF
jgi:outer membrane receptor protein involved in Fe transport